MDVYCYRCNTICSSLLQVNHYSKKAAFMAAFLLIIFSITALLYWQGLNGPFLLDDVQNLCGAKIRDPSWQEWFRVSFANNSGPFGRPLSVASLALNEYWLGSEAFGYKLINVCLHLTIGLLIYKLIYQLSVQLESNNDKTASIIALITTFIWLIHPLQVSTVLYAVQRMAQMGTFFLVLGMLFYVQGRVKLSFLCWPLAILSKETGVLLPFYLLAIEYFIENAKHPNPKKLHHLLIISTLTALFSVAYYLNHYALYYQDFINKGYTLGQQIFTQIEILGFYIRLIFLPKLSHMSLFQDDFPIVTQISWTLLFSITFFLSLMLVIFLTRKKYPILAFGVSFFFISHLIESSVLPLELVFEHRNYLAILGLIFIPSYYIGKSIIRVFNLFIIISPLLIILCFMTFIRIQSWSNAELFLKLELLEHPNSPRAQVEWANFLLENNEFAQADIHLNLAHSLAPNNAGVILHRILIQCEQPHGDKKMIQQALNDIQYKTITPYAILVLDNLVQKSFKQQCSSISSENILKILDAGIHNSGVQTQKNYLATLYHLRAGMHVLHHNMHNAIQDLDTAYQLYPKRLGPLIEKVKLQIALKEQVAAQNTLNTIITLAQTQWIENRPVLIQLHNEIQAINP